MTIHDLYRKVSRPFRRRRMADFIQTFQPIKGTRILDVGGYPGFWAEVDIAAHVTTLNLQAVPVAEAMRHRCSSMEGDGTNLPFDDGEFDIVFSNSVIEHLGHFEAQARFAREIRRVGRKYYVQTPAREFFVEPHLLTPFVHWLPVRVQRRLLRHWTVWGRVAKPTRGQVEQFLSEVRLLTFGEFSELFPERPVSRERVFGLTKSYVAIRAV